MLVDQILTEVGFHEATIVALSHAKGEIRLRLERVSTPDGTRNLEVVIDGVRSVLRDGVLIEELRLEREDGEILALREATDGVVFAVEWNDFSAKTQETVVYDLVGGHFRRITDDGLSPRAPTL